LTFKGGRLKRRKICFFTGSRAEYGLMSSLIGIVSSDPSCEEQIIVSGTHVEPDFGDTYKEIEADGFTISQKIKILGNDSSSLSIVKAIGTGINRYGEALKELSPDIAVVVGDRFESLAFVIACYFSHIPVAHLAGGKVTEGSFDDSTRHAITKFSHFHFAGNETYRQRIIQLGESPENVYCFGTFGIEAIKRTSLLTRNELEQSLHFSLKKRNLLITFHPEINTNLSITKQCEQLLESLTHFLNIDTLIIFTMPNADEGSTEVSNPIKDFCLKNSNAIWFYSLGATRYYSLLPHINSVIGNSSSIIYEVPHFRKPSVNIGRRQDGRIEIPTIIDCNNSVSEITSAINKSLSTAFIEHTLSCHLPIDSDDTFEKIFKILKNISLDSLLYKKFHDL
jgi:GDP/UDP-N,N'-diacetylbacillosamine 2-epimerase (hydrolysing)